MAGRAIKVRMFNVGFGDCLLLRFPCVDRERTMLVDCGRHKASKAGNTLDVIVGEVIKEVTDAQGVATIDVVLATHRHLDHVDGFKDPRWSSVQVSEVWMPWTEDPTDPEAARIRDAQSKASLNLMALGAGADPSIQALAENSSPYSNAAAMSMLHAGFANSPKRFYLPEKPDGASPVRSGTFTSPALPGVNFTLLGPGRTAREIKDMEPPANEQYLRVGGSDRLELPPGKPLPFDDLTVAESAYRADYSWLSFREQDLEAIVKGGGVGVLDLAVALDKAVNGTSVVLIMELEGQRLLFAGDTEWGTWARVMNDPTQSGLLDGLSLYKVSHHGSRNGTPVDFVTKHVKAGLSTMVSVSPTSIASWKDIPRQPLLDDMRKHGASVVETDAMHTPDPNEASRKRAGVELELGPGDLWAELTLPVG